MNDLTDDPNEYTPTDAGARDSFVADQLYNMGIDDDGSGVAFRAIGLAQDAWHRWLAKHDAEIADKVRQEALDYINEHEHPDDWGVPCVYTSKLRTILAPAPTTPEGQNNAPSDG